MSPKIAVHQFNSGITARDGIGNTMFYAQELLRGLGLQSEIYVEHFGPGLKGPVKLLNDLRPSRNDILLIHHSFLHESLDRIEALECRKALVYHSITPPTLYERSDRLFTQTAQAYQQIERLGNIVESSIAVSAYNARQLRLRGLRNVTVIPFHKDFATVRYALHRKLPYYDEESVFRLLYVGRITSHKCQHELIDLVGSLRTIRSTPLELVLIGHADHGRDYKLGIDRQIEDLDLVGRIKMLGSIPDDELYGHYRSANAFVSFSEHEGFGVPLLEAMTLDLPVIAYGAAAVPDTIGDAGILLPDKASETVLTHLLRLHDDRPFRGSLLRKQRERVLRYSRDRVEGALRQWLERMGAFEGGKWGGIAGIIGNRMAKLFDRAVELPSGEECDRTIAAHDDGAGLGVPVNRTTETIDFESPSDVAVSLPNARVHYVLEGPFETSYSLACDNREIAAALARRDGCVAYIEPAEGVEDYRVDAAAASRLRQEVKDLVRPLPLTTERTVTIRQMHPPRPNGMLGDVRLMHLPWEESAIPHHLAELINLHTDGVVVASEFCKRVARNSGVYLPISVIADGIDHFPAEAAATERRHQRGQATAAAPFTFLHISSGLARKGIEELLTAYCSSFSSSDPVLLVIKTFKHDHNVAFALMSRIACSRFSPAIQIVAEELNSQQMSFLYQLADAVVLPTRGEGFCYPAAEAMARGIPIIITGYGGQLDFCNNRNSALIDYAFEFSRSHLKVPNSLWARPSISHLVELMRAAYRDDRARETPSTRRAANAHKEVQSLRWATVAQRLDRFVTQLHERPVMTRKLRLAWVSPYNAKDGIATNSQNLLRYFDPNIFDVQILADQAPPVGKDPDNMLRIWANREGTLERLKNHVISGSFDAVYIQFHFAYFDLFDLARLLQAVHAAGIDTYLALHRTRDHDLFKASLREIADTLKTCTRLFVHGLEDVNRFKEMGVIDNVVLLPPGLAAPPAIHLETARGLLGLQRFSPIVGTFGFLAPHKGFQAVIQAFALVLRDYPEALLLMATAQNGNADSAEECERCRAAIRDLGLQGSVIMITDFIEDEEEAIFLLSSCDAIVFGYQYSMEAASGAIRIGLASGRPVGGTPLPIFSEFAGLIHRFEGTGPQDILVGLRTLLDAGYPREEVMRKQRSWMASHSWAAQARRIGNIMRGCFEERHSVELRPVGLSTEEANKPVGRSEPGGTLREIIEAEFRALSNRDFIVLTFRRALGREPTPAEIASFEKSDSDATTAAGRWQLIQKISSLAEPSSIVAKFSSEVVDASILVSLDDPRFVESAFRHLLRREPDSVETHRWLASIKSGEMSKRQLVEALMASAEFRALSRSLRVVWTHDSQASSADGGKGPRPLPSMQHARRD